VEPVGEFVHDNEGLEVLALHFVEAMVDLLERAEERKEHQQEQQHAGEAVGS